MGAKLSKKKKGYCLGAGKDGESTETTEVEQKETENQEGQKDAAEPIGEKTPIDDTQNTAANEEQKEEKCGVEDTSGEITKEHSNKGKKPESKPSANQEKVEENIQSQGKTEHVESKTAEPEQVCEKQTEVKSPSEDSKPKTEHEPKETPSIVIEKPTPESKVVIEANISVSKPPEKSATEQSTPVQDDLVVKEVSEPVTVVEVKNTERTPPPEVTEQPVLEKVAKESTQSEKVPEKKDPESIPAEPILKEPVPSQDVEAVESEHTSKTEVVEPEVVEPVSVTEATKPEETSVSEPEPTPEPVQPASKEPETDSAPEPEPVSDPEPIKPAIPEMKPVEITAPEAPSSFPDVKSETDPKPVPCSEPEQILEHKPELLSESLPLQSNEVPEQTTEPPENKGSQDSERRDDPGTDDTQAATVVGSSAEQSAEISEEQNDGHATPLIQNGPSECSVHEEKAEAQPILVEPEAVKEREENGVVEVDHAPEKQSTEQECNLVKENCVSVTEETLQTSKNENDQTTQDIKETHDPSQNCNSEEKIENHKTAAEDVRNEHEPPATEILEKPSVGNGLPIKEEIKVHLENRSDKDLYEMNGQIESNEIQVYDE